MKANDSLLEKAANYYDNKNYKEAIRVYESFIEKGQNSYELYFNLGNCYFRDNQLGYAIYNYERARKLNPNDQDVRINLGIASAKTIDKIDAKENFFISAVKSNLVNAFSVDSWAWLSIVSIFLLCLFFYSFYAGKSYIVRRVSLIFSILFFAIAVIVYLLGNSALNAKNENRFAIVLNPEVSIKNEPNQNGVLKFSLHEGTKVRVIESTNDWVLIKIDNGNEGWVQKKKVGII
ncbi:MAG: tetratricopeptide repeat protein [Bacteroidia bacterium]